MVACSSGTAALHLALESLKLPQGSLVLVPDYTMVACARAVVMAGLVPVFVDCGDDLLMDMEVIEDYYRWRLSPGQGSGTVCAAMAVHVYGRRCNMTMLGEWASRQGGPVWLVEDLAEAHGVFPHRLTDAACWSFYKNKIIAGEEGGAVSFRSKDKADLARRLRSLGFTETHDFQHVPRGHNYRMADCLAEKVLNGLAVSGGAISARRIYEARYDAVCPPEWKRPGRNAPWVYDVRIPGLTYAKQLEVVQVLNRRGIEARCGFRPMSEQEEFEDCLVVGRGNAAKIAPEVFYLPLHVEGGLPADEIFDLIKKVLR